MMTTRPSICQLLSPPSLSIALHWMISCKKLLLSSGLNQLNQQLIPSNWLKLRVRMVSKVSKSLSIVMGNLSVLHSVEITALNLMLSLKSTVTLSLTSLAGSISHVVTVTVVPLLELWVTACLKKFKNSLLPTKLASSQDTLWPSLSVELMVCSSKKYVCGLFWEISIRYLNGSLCNLTPKFSLQNNFWTISDLHQALWAQLIWLS